MISIRELKQIIDADIRWHEKRIPAHGEGFKKGFLAGLRQARLLADALADKSAWVESPATTKKRSKREVANG
jgi:hypothetical protein